MRKVLSIDDSKSVHAFLDRCIRDIPDSDVTFVHAMGVKEGLSILETREKEFSAVLLDMEMPEISGPEGIVLIRKQNPDVPVIILSSKSDPTEIVEMLKKGANDYMMKPITPDILFEKLKTVGRV